MKNYLILIFGALMLLLSACSSEKGGGGGGKDDGRSEVTIQNSTVALTYEVGKSGTVTFSSTGDWTIANNNPQDLSISPTSGKAGNQTLTVKSLATNKTNAVRSLTFSIKPNGGTAKTVTVNQDPVFVVKNLHYDIKPEGETVTVSWSANLNDDVYIRYGGDFDSMWETLANSSRAAGTDGSADVKMTRATNTFDFTFKILPNKTKSVKEGFFMFVHHSNEEYQSDVIVFTQMPEGGAEESTDYSRDGEVSTLLKHSGVEQGIPVVLMGDAYIDKQIESGQYKRDIQQACDYLFSIEPMKSMKNCFDVYSVVAVSKNNVVSPQTSTAFKTEFDKEGSTYVFGDVKICENYAKKALKDEKQMENALLVVIVNDGRQSGTTMPVVTNQPQNGVPMGYSIAFIPVYNDSFEVMMHHEAVGHGLGKLADEYGSESSIYAANGSILDHPDELDELKFCQENFAMLNVSLESDPLKTPWAKLYEDKRFAAEKLNAYEGAYTFPKDAYRPTYESMMRSNNSGFNAISRQLIYKRVMSIAHNHNWTFDYEDFVKFDEPARKATKAVVSVPSGLQKRHVSPIWKIEHK